jgi:HlyD family secretion protein
MPAPSEKLFRPQALDRFSSPDNLDQLMRVVSAKDWIPLVVIGGLFIVFAVWCVFGNLPTAVTGRGVLLRPRRMVPVQALGGGRLEALNVHAGDNIKKGQLIARVDQSEIRRKIEDDRQFLATLLLQEHLKTSTQNQQVSLQTQQDQLERKFLEAQRQSLQHGLNDAIAIDPMLKHRLDSLRKLRESGLIADASAEYVAGELNYRDNNERISDYKAKLEQIDSQLKQLETHFTTLAKENLEASTARENQITDIRSRIAMGELQLAKSGDIASDYAGRVAEIFAAVGQVIPAGGRLLSLDIEDPSTPPISLSYFPIKDGKKIQPGMTVQVTPDTVQRQRFGGIVGKVVSVTPLPVTKEGAVNTIGNPDLAQGIMGEGAYIEVTAQLQTDPSTYSGYHWSSSKGPGLKMSSGLTTLTRVTVEGRAPITYIFPILRETSGVY